MTDHGNLGTELFSVRRERDGDTHTLHLAGELDMAAAPALRRELDWLELAEPKTIVIDVAGLTFIDSEGISVLLHAGTRRSHPVRVTGPRGQVRSVLRFTGVAERLDLAD